MEDAEIQEWLRTIRPVELGIALMGASGKVRSRVTANMSKRAGSVLESNIKRYSTMDAKNLLILMATSHLEESLDNNQSIPGHSAR
jgi:flagellar motor switch protein FliG